MAKNILITGATGTVGRQLIPLLQLHGHRVSILSRKPIQLPNVRTYLWDVYKQEIDAQALAGVDTIIHLAGEGIADQKWTPKRKQEIIDSRVLSTQLLYSSIRQNNAPITSFISASAVGYYGNRGDEILKETSPSGTGFLADCCVAWENAVDEGLEMGIRVVKIRIGIVLSRTDGALASIEKPIKFFLGAPLGTGKQWMPWIHLKDLVKIFATATENPDFNGAYNASSPFPVTNKYLTKSIAQQLNRPVWPFHVPEFILKTLLGEMSILPLMSSNTLVQKLLDTGFTYSFINLDEALHDIYRNPENLNDNNPKS